MVAARRGAIASTMMIAHQFAKIIWWRKVNLATVIVVQAAGTTIHAPWTTPAEVQPPVIFSALTPHFWPAWMTIIAVQMAVILSLTPTAKPFAGIHCLKQERVAMEIAPQSARTKSPAPPISCRVLPQLAPRLAPTLQLSRAIRAMAAAPPDVIALTTMIVRHSVPIMSSRPENSATGIAPALAMTGLLALPIL